jgi:nucleotide-binding universal stress UspA family protein
MTMWPPRTILLASHGSEGARAAEDLALQLCAEGGTIRHLVVVHEAIWKGMDATDWRSSPAVRNEFAGYLEEQLRRELVEHSEALRRKVEERGLCYQLDALQGEPDRLLIAFAQQIHPDLIVLGAPRPRGRAGLRSRMLSDRTLRTLAVPVLIAPRAVD